MILIQAHKPGITTEYKKNSPILYFSPELPFQGVKPLFRGLELSFQGMNLPFQGMKLSFQGMKLSFQGMRALLQGMNLPFLGMRASLQGVKLPFQGMRASLQGVKLPFQGMNAPFQKNFDTTQLNNLIFFIYHINSIIMADYIPSADADFNTWQENLLTIVVQNRDSWGISQDSVTALQTKQSTWATAYATASVKTNRTSADVQAKDDARTDYEASLRDFVAEHLTHSSKVSDSQRERMGLTVHSKTRTAAPVPTTKPEGSVDFSQLLQHTIHFKDSESTGKAKPAGVHGCEIWAKLGDATDFSYLATDTRTPYTAVYGDADAGKTVTYRLRWVNTRGEHGPWSINFSAMIVGGV